MSDVSISGKTVTVERFSLAKAMRVITLLQLLQKQVPEVSKEWATFSREYADEQAIELDRINAMARFGDMLANITEADWERAGHKFRVPGNPGAAEIFFHMGPMIYSRAEEVTLKLLGLIAMPNEVVLRYVKQGDIWERVDELVDEIIAPAALDEIMELGLVAAEVIDGQVLQKAKSVGDRAGNVARLFGWKTTMDSTESETSKDIPVEPNTFSSSPSPSDSDGNQTQSSDSPTTPSETSATPLSASTTSS